MVGAGRPMHSPALLERDHELGVIDRALGQAAGGEGTVMLIEGRAGIGKTALLSAARASASQREMTTLAARGHELEEHFPYGVVRQLFEAVVRNSANPEVELLAGSARLAAPIVLDAGGPLDVGADRNPAYGHLHGLYWLTVRVSQRAALLITVDDVQLADGPSLRFLLHLSRRLEGVAAAVLLSIRTGEGPLERELAAQLQAESEVVTMRPAPLSNAAVAHMLAAGLAQTPDDEFVAAGHVATGGVPFLVRELISALREDRIEPTADRAAQVRRLGPRTVARATVGRLRRSPANSVALARSIAILGSEARLHHAAALADLDESQALQALDVLVDAGVIKPDAPLEFTHPIVRAAIHDELPPGHRSGLHLRAAEVLASEGVELDAVAAQLMASEPTGSGKIAGRLREAAAHALARGAPEDACAYLSRALAEGSERAERAELTFELASAEALGGQSLALEHYHEALRLAEDPLLRARISLGLATMLILTNRADIAVGLLEQALDGLGGGDLELTVRLERLRAGQAAYDPRQVGEFNRRLPILRDLAKRGGQAGGTLALLLAAVDAARGEPVRGVIELVERGWSEARALLGGDDTWYVTQGIDALVIVDELGLAGELIAQVLAAARARGSLQTYIAGTAYHCWVLGRSGRLEAAEAELRAALEPTREQGLKFVLPSLLWIASDVLLERPTGADLVALAEELTLGPLTETFSGAYLLEIRGRARHAAGRTADAIGDLRHAGEILHGLGFINPNASSWRPALALALGGDSDEAHELAADELADALRGAHPRAIGVAHRTLGLLERGTSGREHLEEAVAILDGSVARLEFARALVELGAAMRRDREPKRAREPLRVGLDVAVACGATRLIERAVSELASSGARPRRLQATGRDALTASELRVARLAAEGRTNIEIAEALFVTAKTVDTHLSHTYRKLGITSRRQLAQSLSPAPSER